MSNSRYGQAGRNAVFLNRWIVKRGWLAALFSLSLLVAHGAQAEAIPIAVDLSSFGAANVGGDAANTLLWARGNASTTGGILRVVPATGTQSGIVVRRNQIRLSGGFSTYFLMQLHGGSVPPADGMTFIIQANDTPIVGQSGGGVGYAGISNSIGVEFDIWNNGAGDKNDPDADHVAIVANGNNDHTGQPGGSIQTAAGVYGNDVHVWIDYDGSTVTATWGPNATRAHADNHTITRANLTHLEDQDVFVGFGASTGGANANHDIKKWYFKDAYVNGGLDPAEGYTQAAASVSIDYSPSSTNPATAAIRVRDAAGNAMASQDFTLFLDDVQQGGTLTSDGTGLYTYTLPEGLSAGTHTLRAVASGGTTYSTNFTVSSYTIAYHANNATGGSVPASQSKTHNVELTLRTNSGSLARTGYTYSGWNTATNGLGADYAAGSAYTANAAATLYAKWSANSYTVSFDKQGGAGGSDSVSATYDSAMPAATVPTRTGYTFGGYYSAVNGAGTQYYTAAMASAQSWNVPAATPLYAKWTANSYTVTFDKQEGAGGSASVSATYDSAMPAATAPTRTGYTFGGYYSEANGAGTQYYTGAMASAQGWDVPAAATLYAKWTANGFSVAYNGNGSDGGTTATSAHTYDQAQNLTVNGYTLTGYTFAGWNSLANGTGTAYANSESVINLSATQGATVTLFAQWTANSYSVAYDGNGSDGGTTATSAHTYDQAQNLTANAYTRTGYTFAGWNSLANGSGTSYTNAESVTNLSPTQGATVTLFAQWTANSYTVSFDKQEGAGGSASVSATYDSAMPAATAPTRTGYTFGGYYTAANGAGTQYYTGAMASATNWVIADDTTLYAKWTANSYTVTLDQQNGSGGSVATTATYDSAMPAATAPSRMGYTFGGYYTATNGAGTQYYTAAMSSVRSWDVAGSATLYAKWTANNYTVTLDQQSGSAGSVATTATYDAAMPAATAPTREGYTFGGYYSAPNGGGTPYYTAAMSSVRSWDVAGSATLYAKWTANNYTVTLDQQSGSAGSVATTATYDAAMPAATAPTREGYTFGGYYSAPNGGGTPYYTAAMSSVRSWDVAGNTTLYAQWLVNAYTLSFDSAEGSAVAAITQDFGTAVSAPTAPTREGYTFAGWTPAVPATMPAANQIHTAQWTVNGYILSFDSAGGSAVAAITQDFGSAVSAPATPTREGYTFAGWTPAVPTTMPAASQTHTAQWTVNSYTLSFDSAGGSDVAAITQDFGTAITAPADPTREGYTFAGWEPEIPATLPAANQTHTAEWTAHTFTLTYRAGTGGTLEGESTQQVDYQEDGSEVTAVADEGYRFVEWSDGQTSNPRQDRSITEDLSVEAQFASLHTIGGVLNGLSEGEIVLGLNGGFDSLTLSEEGSFVFSKPLLHGSSYAVVIVEQPEGYTCAITRGRGTVSADVTGVSVGCLVVEDDRPQVAFGSTRQFGTQGEELLIQVVLEGTPKQYPVKVAYEVSGFDLIGQSQPELAVSGEFEFLEEHERTRTLRVVPGTSAGEIRFSLVPTEGIEYGQVGNPAQHTIVLYEPEVVPMIGALKVKQGGIPPTENNLVVPGQGAVTLEVEIDTAVSYDWSVSSAELGIDTQTDAVVSVIEPLPEEGTYPVKVVLREQEGTRTLTLQLNLRVAAVIPEEYFEFYDDVYQEEPHRLPVCPGGEFRVDACTEESEPVYLEVPEGLTVDLGVQSESASWTSNQFAVSIEPDDLKDETGAPAANREDPEFTHLGYLVDFEVSGLDLPGQSIPLVIPLPSGQTVPARAVWRKYHGAEIGWRDFVVDAANQIYSASRTALGSCPWPGAKVWSEGLSEGHECVRLIIQDGGPNDLDGMTDGVIRDPGTLAVPASEKVVIRSKGGSVSVWWLALLSLLPLSGAWQRRRGQWSRG